MEKVLKAVNVLFSASVAQQDRREADEWLKAFQKTPEAWTISNTLLNTPDIPIEAQVFAAQTFRTKIHYDSDELDLNSKKSLYDNILQLLYLFRHGSKSIITQLLLSLADISVSLVDYTDSVSTLCDTYSKDPEMINCVLEFLTVLPEELHDHRLLNSEEIQIAGEKLLFQNAKKVLNLLLNVEEITDSSVAIAEYKLKCLYSWLRSGDLTIHDIHSTALLKESFSALETESLFDVGCDLICEIVYRATRQPRNLPLIEYIYSLLVPLSVKINDSLDDNFKMRGLCRVFVEAGEAFVEFIVMQPQVFKSIIEGLFTFTAYEELEVVSITFNFWQTLTDEILLKPECLQNPYFFNVFSTLVSHIIARLKYPDESEQFTATERDEFRDFRYSMGDILKDCVRVLGEDRALEIPFNLLSTAMSSGGGWQSFEAPIFAFRTMCREVSLKESRIIPLVMEMLPKLPQHPKIRYAVILTMGRYAEWTNVHPEFLQYQLQFVSSGFEDSESLAASAQTLKDLCKYCNLHLVDFLPQLHPFYLGIMKGLPHQEKRQVVEAIAHVLSAVPLSNLLGAFQSFCLPLIQRLHEISLLNTSSEPVEIIKETIDLIDSFATFLKYLNPKIPSGSIHPCQSVLVETWPILSCILSNFVKTQKVAESGARFMRNCIMSFKKYISNALLADWAEKLCVWFDQSGFGCWVWICSKFIRVYGEDGSETMHISNAIVEKITISFFRILGHGEPQISLDEVTEDYFFMLTEYLEASPRSMTSHHMLPSMFECAIKSTTCTSAATLVSIYAWIIELLETVIKNKIPPEYYNNLQQLLNMHGSIFIQASFQGLLNNFPKERELVVYVGGSMNACFKIIGGLLFEYVNGIIESFGEEEMPRNLKENFKMKFKNLIESGDNEKVGMILQEFSISFVRRNMKKFKLRK